MPRVRSEMEDLDFVREIIRRHPPLKREPERALAVAAKTGDKRAREKMASHNLALVVMVARKYAGRGVRLDDLVQEGNYGLIKAIDSFEPERGLRFSTYAVWWIRACVSRAMKRDASSVKPNVNDRMAPPRDIYLDAPVNGEPGDARTLKDDLVDERPLADEQSARAQMSSHVRAKLRVVRKRLGELNWTIIRERLSSDDPSTLEDLAVDFGYSRERIRQQEKSTREFLARYLADLGAIEQAA